MNTLRSRENKEENFAFAILEQAKKDYRHSKDVYDLIEMDIFIASNYFIMYCWLAKENPDRVKCEILNSLPEKRRFKRVTVGRIANLMNFPAKKAIDWCVKTNNCQMKKGKQKMVDYKQACKLVRYIRGEK